MKRRSRTSTLRLRRTKESEFATMRSSSQRRQPVFHLGWSGFWVRYHAIVVAAPTASVPPRLVGILDGSPEGIIQFHELPGAGSIGDEKRGGLMAGFTKPPLYGAAYEKRGIVKGVVLMSRASTQPTVEYVSGLLNERPRLRHREGHDEREPARDQQAQRAARGHDGRRSNKLRRPFGVAQTQHRWCSVPTRTAQ